MLPSRGSGQAQAFTFAFTDTVGFADIGVVNVLVNDLLDLGRIEAGFDTRRDDVALENILHFTADNLGRQIMDKRIDFTMNVDPDLPILRGNPIRLRQMVDNLLVNAVKYTPEGGKVRVSLRREDSQIILEVSDTGVGIPASDQPHIFEKFYRVDDLLARQAEGSGLGLSIVRHVIRAHRGRIVVDSEPGRGSTFTIVLPLRPGARGHAEPRR